MAVATRYSSSALAPASRTALQRSVKLSASSALPSDDMIRQDIEKMRKEARLRLQHLSSEMDDFISHHKSDSDAFLHEASPFENAKVPEPSQVVVDQTDRKAPISVENLPKEEARNLVVKEACNLVAPPSSFVQSSLLYDTRWKVAIQIGTKATQRYKEKPLILHLILDFSPDKLKESDDLLQGSANAKTLEIKEAWIGASSITEGHQRNVRIKPTGGWKVLPGQGPKGIDILRFYLDVEEEISHSKSSNLRCPANRVYCTAGVFSMHHHKESELFKDCLRSELDKLAQRHEELISEEEKDERSFSFDRLKRAKQMMDLRNRIRDMNQKITQARIRNPEKSMLRLARKGDVGVTKDGQVCYRETKGMSSEYIVLGKMEMASIHKPVIETQRDGPTELRP